MDDNNKKLISWILKVAVGTLASIIILVVVVMMVGLFVPNEQIDNNKIFEMIGPAFNTVIGAFVGLLGGLSLNSEGQFWVNKKNDQEEQKQVPQEVESNEFE